MGIVRWDPFRDLINLQDRMNKLFDESLSHGRFGEDEQLMGSTWNPTVDIYETKDQVIFKVEVPGLKQEDIKIEMTENTLTLRGERRFEEEIKEENYHCIERSYGSFIRSFKLPISVQQDKISAGLKAGILEIVITKTKAEKVKQIEIATEE